MRLAVRQSLTMCVVRQRSKRSLPTPALTVWGAGARNRAPIAMLPAPARGQLVQGLDSNREPDRSVDIPFGDVEAGAVGDQRHADQQQETQCQHLHSRVSLDKIGKGL